MGRIDARETRARGVTARAERESKRGTAAKGLMPGEAWADVRLSVTQKFERKDHS